MRVIVGAAVSRTVTDRVAFRKVLEALGQPADSPPLPDWVQAWIAGDAGRPWPPELPQAARSALS